MHYVSLNVTPGRWVCITVLSVWRNPNLVYCLPTKVFQFTQSSNIVLGRWQPYIAGYAPRINKRVREHKFKHNSFLGSDNQIGKTTSTHLIAP